VPETVAALLRSAGRRLEAAGSGSPGLDAQVLLGHVLGRSRTWLYTWPENEPSAQEIRAFLALVERRAAGEPVAYLIGRREFWSLELSVTPATLIPRPETELLVERALMLIPPDADWTVADLGTGSGAIALAIASERPACRIVATDRSGAALAVAAANSRRLGLSNVLFCRAEWLACFGSGCFQVVISNPPYIAEGDAHLENGDVRHEPRSALTAGSDGLDDIRIIASESRRTLTRDGRLLLEHGYDQGPAVKNLLSELGFVEVLGYCDGQGHDRMTEGRWSGSL
jgi:release factor glutamine methyltransferase